MALASSTNWRLSARTTGPVNHPCVASAARSPCSSPPACTFIGLTAKSPSVSSRQRISTRKPGARRRIRLAAPSAIPSIARGPFGRRPAAEQASVRSRRWRRIQSRIQCIRAWPSPNARKGEASTKRILTLHNNSRAKHQVFSQVPRQICRNIRRGRKGTDVQLI